SLVLCDLLHLPIFCSTHADTSQTSTLSLHDALPISWGRAKEDLRHCRMGPLARFAVPRRAVGSKVARWWHVCGWPGSRSSGCARDRKSTRLNSSHGSISYAVFCLKKKKTTGDDDLLS